MNVHCSWPCPPTHPELCATEVHLWFADLLRPAEVVRALVGVLSADERSHADQLYLGRDRRRYIVGRALLRQILGRYLGLNGQDIAFRYGQWGKPTLTDYEKAKQLEFNLSHSAEVVVYAFAANRRVGVDIESIRPIPDADDIMDRFFPLQDRRSYHSLSANRREEAFFQYWTRREAFLKAIGYGLTGADTAGDATGSDMRQSQSLDGQEGKGQHIWSLLNFSPTLGHIGAVAAEGDQCDLKYYNACEVNPWMPPMLMWNGIQERGR